MKSILVIILFATCLVTEAFGQEYLDSDKRYMKIIEVSDDPAYGYDVNNPINVGSEEKAIAAYLNSLIPIDGDRIHIGDLAHDYNGKKGLTLVVLTHEQKKASTTIYFLSTHFEQPKAMIGFTFKTIDDLPKAIAFPVDSIVKMTFCSKTIYSVDDYAVKEKYGESTLPSIAPTFKGGLGELKKYFASNPLTDEKLTQMIFRVKIAFVVNCENKAGNFQIVSEGKGDLATYANEVLAIVNRMPQNWQSATVDGKAVDCYQVLSFTIAGGNLEKVSYR